MTHRLLRCPLLAMDGHLETAGGPKPIVVLILDALDEADHLGKGPVEIWNLVANRSVGHA